MAFSKGTSYGLTGHKGASWAERARCRDSDPEMFSPLGQAHKTIAEAVAVCRRCPLDVQLECLIEGEAAGDVWTIRGGRTGPERQAHRLRGLKPHQYPPHVPGVMWCRRCHLSFRYDKDDPNLNNMKLCPDCRVAAKAGKRREDVCTDCERFLPIHGSGKCSGCFGSQRRLVLHARWCQRCEKEFRPPKYKPKAHICAECAATHPDKRVRDQHVEVAS